MKYCKNFFIGIIFVIHFSQLHGAQVTQERPSPVHFHEYVAIVEQETALPRVLAKLIASYRGPNCLNSQKTFPAEDVPCVEHALSDELLACVTHDGKVITKSLEASEILKITELFSAEEKEKYCVECPIMSFGGEHLVVPVNIKARRIGGLIRILNTKTGEHATIPIHEMNSPKSFVFALLPNDELVICNSKGSNMAKVFDIKTGQYKRDVDYGEYGHSDMVTLPDARVAAARNKKVIFSNLSVPLEKVKEPLSSRMRHSSPQVLYVSGFIDHLALLPGNKLAVATTNHYSEDVCLETFDCEGLCDPSTIEYKSPLSRIEFKDEKSVRLAILADGDIAIKKQRSGAVDIVYSDGARETLPIDGRVATIQGLPSGALFIRHDDRTRSLWSKKFSAEDECAIVSREPASKRLKVSHQEN